MTKKISRQQRAQITSRIRKAGHPETFKGGPVPCLACGRDFMSRFCGHSIADNNELLSQFRDMAAVDN